MIIKEDFICTKCNLQYCRKQLVCDTCGNLVEHCIRQCCKDIEFMNEKCPACYVEKTKNAEEKMTKAEEYLSLTNEIERLNVKLENLDKETTFEIHDPSTEGKGYLRLGVGLGVSQNEKDSQGNIAILVIYGGIDKLIRLNKEEALALRDYITKIFDDGKYPY